MWYAVYDKATKALKALGTQIATPEQLAARNYTYKEVGEERPLGTWDPATLTFVYTPPAPSRILTPAAFVDLFTPEEVQAIRTSPDVKIKKWLYRVELAQEIELYSSEVSQGLSYLTALNLIAPGRKEIILT